MSCVSSTLGKFQGSFQAGNSSSCLLAPSPTLPPAVASSASQGAGRGARVLSAHPPPRAFLPPPWSSLLFSSLDLGHRRVLAPGSRVLGYSDLPKTAHSTRPRLLGGLCLPPTRRGAGRVCTGYRSHCSTNVTEKTGAPVPAVRSGESRRLAGCQLECFRFPLPSVAPLGLAWDSFMGCRRQHCPSPRHGPSQASLGRGSGHLAAEPACPSYGRRNRWNSPSAGSGA